MALLAWLTSPRYAHAGGDEVTAFGARALGRGGALMASAQDSDALRYNPARLGVSRQWSVGTDVQMHFGATCFTRTNYEDGTSYPKVCSNKPAVIPQLAASIPIGKKLGLGIGLLIPPGGTPLDFGNKVDGTIKSAGMRIPSPARYALLTNANTAAFFATVGLGVERKKYRLGASFGWGIYDIRNTNFTAGLPGEAPALDARNAISVVDNFVPRVMVAADFDLTKRWNVALQGTWTDDVRAHGSLFVSGITAGKAYSTRVDEFKLKVPNGWQTGLGSRYRGEGWDLEGNVLYEGNSRRQEIGTGVPANARLPISGIIDGQDISKIILSPVQKHWRDQWVIRIGGDYQAIPEKLTVRGGFSYESSGVQHGYESVDNLPLQRVGVHAGLSVQITKRTELNLAYALIMFPTTHLSTLDSRLEQPVGQRPNQLRDAHPTINAGTYTTGVQALALSVMYRAR